MPLVQTVRRARFVPTRITAISPVASDAVAVDLAIPPAQGHGFTYQAGQYLTVRGPAADTSCQGVPAQAQLPAGRLRVASVSAPLDRVSRDYSLVESPAWSTRTGVLRIGVREAASGRMSVWLNKIARPGDVLEVAAPRGELIVPQSGTQVRHVGILAAGSGITPGIAIIETELAADPGRCLTAVVANRTPDSAMFRRRLLDLEHQHPNRLRLLEVFSRALGANPLLTGRLDADKLHELAATTPAKGGLALDEVDLWLVSGAEAFVRGATSTLSALGVPSAHMRSEVFSAAG